MTDDTVAMPAGAHVDDVVSATLNYAEEPVARGGRRAGS